MEDVIEILSSIHPEVDYETETGLIDKKIFDSFDIVTLVGELMDEFDIEITAEHMVPENFNSAQAIYELIQSLQEE
ncbi:MAG: acyl carrier protein [Lachnospiraceae bacterium]|nr:acyl carrier protein [Lachnospiraceae bacterium]MBR2275074.1 acyl carrier protein [Lachnospiraceae bacterium]